MLVSSQNAVKGKTVLRSQSGWRFARWGLGRGTKKRSSRSKYALEIKPVLGCFYVFDIAKTEIHTGKEYNKYQGMR